MSSSTSRGTGEASVVTGSPLKASADPFYALARESHVWSYDSECDECEGLWPLEALCLALLLDEGIRCDVALAVCFAQCLKTAGDPRQADVFEREIALRPMSSKTTYGEEGTPSNNLVGLDRSKKLIELSVLPTKEAIGDNVKAGEAFPLLYSTHFADSLDVVVIVFTTVVGEVDDDTPLKDYDPTDLLFVLLEHNMKRFRLLANIMLLSPQIRRCLAGETDWQWEALWECPTPEDAVMVVKTLGLGLATLEEDSIGWPPGVYEPDAAIIYAVYEAFGALHELDFTHIPPRLDTGAIIFFRIRGHLRDLDLSDAETWIDRFSSRFQDWRIDRLQYLKTLGASFQGAGGIFGRMLARSKVTDFKHLFECLKFCIENDPVFPRRFSPSMTLSQLLHCDDRSHKQCCGRQFLTAAVKYVHRLAVQHDLLAPDPVSGDTMLTALARIPARVVTPTVRLNEITGGTEYSR